MANNVPQKETHTIVYSIGEINSTQMTPIRFDASVIKVKMPGNQDTKKPFVATIKLETSGENIDVVGWCFDVLPILERNQNTLNVFTFEGMSSTYNNNVQLKIGKIIGQTAIPSTKKALMTDNKPTDQSRNAIQSLMSTDIIQSKYYRKLVEDLILMNDNFFTWPAAKSIHHNFKGGLAMHSIDTAHQAIAFAKYYNNDKAPINVELVATAALLHDIGKLKEYSANAEDQKPIDSILSNHVVDGVQMIIEKTISYRIPLTSKEFMLLKACILSHHGQTDTGAIIVPPCIEGICVSLADLVDSKIQSGISALLNIGKDQMTDHLRMLQGGKLIKWQ